MEGNKEIFKQILDIVFENETEQKRQSREELAEQLNIKISTQEIIDGPHIQSWVISAYESSKKSGAITKLFEASFSNNDGQTPLFTPTIINPNYQNLESENHSSILVNELEKINLQADIIVTMETIKNNLSKLQSEVETKEKSGNFLDKINGSSKIIEVQATGEKVFNKYVELINLYDNQKTSTQHFIDQFCTYRRKLQFDFEDIIEDLILIFGDKIRVTDPVLFDFTQINYLESAKFKSDTQNHFKQLDKECKTFLLTHRHNLNMGLLDSATSSLNSLNNTFKGFEKRNKKVSKSEAKAALATEGITLLIDVGTQVLNSRKEASEKASILWGEIEQMRALFKKDKEVFQRDLLRLIDISNTIGDFQIRKTKKFLDNYNRYTTSGIAIQIKKILLKPEVLEHRQKLISKINEIRKLNTQKADNISNINLNEIKVMEHEYHIQQNLPLYEKCIANEPSKPGVFKNILSFGLANTLFISFYANWNHASIDYLNHHKYHTNHLNKVNSRIIKLKSDISILDSDISKLNDDTKVLRNTIIKITANFNDEISEIKKELPIMSKILKEAKENLQFSIEDELIQKAS